MIESQIIHFPELPFYLTVKKVTDSERDIVSIFVESKIHINKEVKLPTQYSIDYVKSNPKGFIADVFHQVIKQYGLKLEPVKYR